MSKKLEELVVRTRKITMTPDQLREQRRSFAYGNTNIENERITREMVAKADRKIEAEEPYKFLVSKFCWKAHHSPGAEGNG
jgi:hypothetical protein